MKAGTSLNKIRITNIEPGKTGPYAAFIPADELPWVESGRTAALGIESRDGLKIGALITEPGGEPDGGPGRVLVITGFRLKEDYHTADVVLEIIANLAVYSKTNGLTGLIVQTLHPDDSYLESILDGRFERLEDGNTVYEIRPSLLRNKPIIRREYPEIYDNIVSISDMTLDEQSGFLDKFSDRFPAGFTREELPAKWKPDLSFVCKKGDEYIGYIISSELSKQELYVGSLYVEQDNGITAAAIVGRFGREVIYMTRYKQVMFAAASPEGRKLCEYLIKDITDVKIWEIHNYYLEVKNGKRS